MKDIERIMSRPVFTCGPNETLDAAAKQMWDHDCGTVAVVDETGRLVGMVTDRDICMAAFTRAQRLSEITVETVMSSDLAVCRTTDPIASLEGRMKEKQVRRIPVVDGSGRPIGIVSVNDLARAAARTGPSKAEDISGLADTLAAICEPRRHATYAA
jgi:CBS domain-containing protein